MFKVLQRFFVLALVFSFVFSSEVVVFAEDIGRETETVRRETFGTQYASRVSDASENKAQIEKWETGVTFEDVLKDPDNIKLNFRYAQDQIARRELVGASATLERILLIKPNLVDVRLLYAVVLYRLDSLDEAQKELDLMRDVPLPDNIKKELKQYEKKIKYRKKRTHISVRESVGWGFDTNRNASPRSKQQLFFDTAINVQGTDVRRDDTHFINVTTVDVEHDLGFQSGHSVFASFTYFLQEQTQVDSLDLGSFQYEFGGTYKGKYFDFKPSFFATHLFISRESFLRSQGGNFLFKRDFGKKVSGFYNFRVERQDYMNITENSTSMNRKGPQFDHFWGVHYMLLPTMRWTTILGYGDKNAKLKYYAYNRLSLSNTHTWILPKGQFLINTLTAYFDRYRGIDTAVAGRHRRDKIMRYRATYGAPLETLLIGKIFPGPFKDIVFTLSYEYYHAVSSVTNYTYNNNKIEGLFTKRFEF